MSELKELIAQRAALDKQIAQAQRESRENAIVQVKALMAEHGLTVGDLSARQAKAGAKSSRSGGKVPPKYRNKATGETWSGRGLQPRWLKAALATGKKLADFAV
jgi:DNA-binding protein H-NS